MNEENQGQADQKNCGSCVSKVEILIRAGIELSTLGGHSRIIFGEDLRNRLFCETNNRKLSKSTKRYSITTEQIIAVCSRYSALKKDDQIKKPKKPRHLAAGEYNQRKWKAPGITGLIVCPYIATLINLLDQLGEI
jgi:hypothetical protein